MMDTAQLVGVSPKAQTFLDCPRGAFVVPVLPLTTGKVSLVVPTYQEAGNIQALLIELCAILDRHAAFGYEVIVVDDNSTDGTWLQAAQLAPDLPAVRVIRRKGERGLAAAVFRGYQAATGEILGTINADFQHPPEVIAALIEGVRQADIAVASRFCDGGGTGDWPQERLLLSRAALQAGKLMLPEVFSELTDPLSGCYLFRRTLIEGIAFTPLGFKTLIEIMARSRTGTVKECPYQMRSRRNGASKASIESSLSYLMQLRHLQALNAA
jgi:dolichol-phosphate mannosyltransferase